MFERFDDRARLVVVHAQEEARGLRHAAISGEHLLLGACAVDPPMLGFEMGVLRGRDVARWGAGTTDPPDCMPFTPAARRALEIAVEHAADRRDAVLRDSGTSAAADPVQALRQGYPVAVTPGSGMPLGDVGSPNTDRRLLEAMLVAGGPAERLLRDHGVSEQALRELRRR